MAYRSIEITQLPVTTRELGVLCVNLRAKGYKIPEIVRSLHKYGICNKSGREYTNSQIYGLMWDSGKPRKSDKTYFVKYRASGTLEQVTNPKPVSSAINMPHVSAKQIDWQALANEEIAKAAQKESELGPLQAISKIVASEMALPNKMQSITIILRKAGV